MTNNEPDHHKILEDKRSCRHTTLRAAEGGFHWICDNNLCGQYWTAEDGYQFPSDKARLTDRDIRREPVKWDA